MMVVRSRLQLTLAILKPDLMMHPVRTKKVKKIIKDKGFLVVHSKVTQLNQQEAEKFYEEHKERFFYTRLITFMSSGPLTAMILARENCITLWRDLMGPTKTYRARDLAPTSIRALYGISDTRNATHGSDSDESAQKEIGFFFPDFCSNHWGENLEPLYREKRHELIWDDNQGRPPWYNLHGELKEPFVIGLCGGSASGKTTVANKIIEQLGVPWVCMLSLDSFYKVLNAEQHEAAKRNEYNFDHPDSFDHDLAATILKKLKEGKSVQIPIYDFKSHSRLEQKKNLYGANVIIFEGIMAFAYKDLRDLMDMKVFVDADPDVRLSRRLKRDITERERDLVGVLQQYNTYVKPAFDQYIAPTMIYADIVVPRGGENNVAIDLIVRHVRTQLEQRGFNFREKLRYAHQGQPLPCSLSILESTPQVRGLHAIIRNEATSRDDFIFYSKRLMRILIEHALSHLPFKKHVVTSMEGTTYEGRKFAGKRLCGVSILRAGETMEPALESVCKDVRIGKILIQTNEETFEPELHYYRLPKGISEDHVILMDATLATGAAALMAIRVLLDHDVREENILFLSLIAAESGVHTIAYAYPNVKIITAAVDHEVNDKYHIIPGIGNFGDRYFGTADY